MSILRFGAVRRKIGTFVILDDVSAAIAAGERVGVVGANGAGKTTLLRLAARADEPDRGVVAHRRGLRVGLLAQEANLDDAFTAAATVRAAVRSGAAELEAIERQLTTLESAGPPAVASSQYADLRARFDARDGYALDQRVEAALSGLGSAPDEWERSPTQLSGGQQTHTALARLLVADPELLLLDEPTNHLDVSALEWLEDHLVRRSGALLVASHDRWFLDAVVTRIWELRDRRLQAWRGDYSAYLLQREAADARLRKEAGTRAEQIEREKELVQRYRSHRKYGKMHEHERRLAALEPLEEPRREARLALPAESLLGGGPVRSGDLALAIRDALIGFAALGDRAPVPVAEVPRLEARRGERIGIVGPNGAGKTTLLRTIAGELAPLEGTVRLGAAVQPGYLAQVRRRAFPGATVLDALLEQVNVDNGPARSYLARFLFRGDDVFKPVAELSGGERSRLELALLGVTPANVLLLDEPTNHLDIPAREALEAFLREFPGTILVVSHDRRLLETVCERLWVAEPAAAGPARFTAFDGGWRAWREAVTAGWTVGADLELQARRLDGITTQPAAGQPAGRPTGRAAESRPQPRAPARVAVAKRPAARMAGLSKDAYRRQKEAVEGDLTRLGLRKNHLELALGRPDVQANFVELRRLTSELADVDAALAQAEDAWLALEERAPR